MSGSMIVSAFRKDRIGSALEASARRKYSLDSGNSGYSGGGILTRAGFDQMRVRVPFDGLARRC